MCASHLLAGAAATTIDGQRWRCYVARSLLDNVSVQRIERQIADLPGESGAAVAGVTRVRSLVCRTVL